MKKRWLILLLISLFILIEIFLSTQMSNFQITSQITGPLYNEEKIVTKIIDGDTIIIEGGETIRFIGIDCDEKGKPCYNEAKEYLENSILGKKVLIESDSEDKDQYGRSLRYIFLDGTNINKKMVSIGLCVARFEAETKYKEEIKDAEKEAISGKIGCKWS